MMTSFRLKTLLTGICALILSISVYAERDNKTCGIIPGEPLTNGYGPFDFTNPSHQKNLSMVLLAHFTSDVEKLTKGSTDTTPHGDIDYTLRAIPNYHRALYAISKLDQRDRRQLKPEQVYRPRHYTAECYFKRALYMQPNDPISHMLYAMHLLHFKRTLEAEKQYLLAIEQQPNNPELNYNIGLFYADTGNLEVAKKYATIAYSKGYPLDGLKRKIESLAQKNELIKKDVKKSANK